MIIDSRLYNPDAEPRAWLISKINRISPDGIARVTLAQDTYDQHNDYIERDSNGNVLGMWANYYNSNVEPTPIIPDQDDTPSTVTAKITCSGKPQFKIGGSPKTFTVTYYDSENQEITDHAVGSWALYIDGERLIGRTVMYEYISDQPNKIKITFNGDDSYIGKVITVTNESIDVTATMQVEVTAL